MTALRTHLHYTVRIAAVRAVPSLALRTCWPLLLLRILKADRLTPLQTASMAAREEPVAAGYLEIHLRKSWLRVSVRIGTNKRQIQNLTLVTHHFIVRHIELHEPKLLARKELSDLRKRSY